MKKQLFLRSLLILLTYFFSPCSAQTLEVDSLKLLLDKNKADTSRTAQVINAECLDELGTFYHNTGDYFMALKYYNESKGISELLKDTSGIASSLNNIGVIYKKKGDYTNALKNYFEALRLNEMLGNKGAAGGALNNIGIVYYTMAEYSKALEYFLKTLKMQEEIGDKYGLNFTLNNLGTLYNEQKNYAKSLECLFRALKLSEESGDVYAKSYQLNNIGLTYDSQGNHPEALKYYFRSLALAEKHNSKDVIALANGNLGGAYLKENRYDEAEKYLKAGLDVATEIGELFLMKEINQKLSDLYVKTNRYQKAYEHYMKYTAAKDSLFSMEKDRDLTRKEMNYEFEKKEMEVKGENDKKAAVAAAENKKQKIIIWSVIIGLLLVMTFAVFVFRSLRFSQKQKQIIEKQKEVVEEQKQMVEEKHKEISDSINYAERIQRSFLATKDLLDENLNEYFVLFQPKDVVSGDFYWGVKLGNGDFIIVVADSTGHGVPGAIMSILNISCLENSVEVEKLSEPGEILNNTRSRIIERLKKDGSLQGGKDGMDASLIRLASARNKLTYAAANNPIWIVRDDQLLEFSPDKMPVGKHDKDVLPFGQHEVDLQKGDLIYAFTDGFPDQFGGPKGKKFMYKQLKEILLSSSSTPMAEQRQILENALINWKGNLEQVDDILIIGIRI